MLFTVEEMNLMCCFDTSSRSKLIAEMKDLSSNDPEPEMAELLHKTVKKLEKITEAEFDKIIISEA